jgi:serine phosphatase RsbU (regulator of sigma subunit)
MPAIPKDLAGFEVNGWYRSAERTSGDFFDFVKLRNKRFAAVVADVSGHGVGPALVSTSAKAALSTGLRLGADTATAVTMLNQDLCDTMESGMFLTLLVLVFGEDGSCEILNAGHHGPMVWRANEQSVECIDAHGPALGWIGDTNYSIDASIKLASGDVLLAYTDGLIEAHSPTDREKLFGDERVRELLSEFARKGQTTEEITRGLAEAALSFSGQGQEDDITLVVVKKV